MHLQGEFDFVPIQTLEAGLRSHVCPLIHQFAAKSLCIGKKMVVSDKTPVVLELTVQVNLSLHTLPTPS